MSDKLKLIKNDDGIITVVTLGTESPIMLHDGSVSIYADTMTVDGKEVKSEKELFDRLNND